MSDHRAARISNEAHAAHRVQTELEDELTLLLGVKRPRSDVLGTLVEGVERATGLAPEAMWDEVSFTHYYDSGGQLSDNGIKLRLKHIGIDGRVRSALTAKWAIRQMSPGREVSVEITAHFDEEVDAPARSYFLAQQLPAKAAATAARAAIDELGCVLRLRQDRTVLRFEVDDAAVLAVLDDVEYLETANNRGYRPARYLDIEYPIGVSSGRHHQLVVGVTEALCAASGGTPSPAGKVSGILRRITLDNGR